MGSEDQQAGSEGLPKGFEGLPEGPKSLPEGPEGLPERPEGVPKGDRWIDRQRDAPHSTAHSPLSEPLPKKKER